MLLPPHPFSSYSSQTCWYLFDFFVLSVLCLSVYLYSRTIDLNSEPLAPVLLAILQPSSLLSKLANFSLLVSLFCLSRLPLYLHILFFNEGYDPLGQFVHITLEINMRLQLRATVTVTVTVGDHRGVWYDKWTLSCRWCPTWNTNV